MIETPDKTDRGDLSNRHRAACVSRWLSIAVLLTAVAGFVLGLAFEFGVTASSMEPVNWKAAQEPNFSQFSHRNPNHSRLPCLLCHRRENDSARPGRSSVHAPCAGCHSQQFSASGGPICAICHTNVESGSHEIKRFPALKSFNMTFDHARHKNVGCATCHKPANRGVSFSIPAGFDAHTTCYKCHSRRAQANGRDISSCATCHKPGRYTRTPTLAKAFKVSFSHDQHERSELNCSDCHKLAGSAMQGKQVGSPLPTEHPASDRVSSCMTCHNDVKAFGIASFANCKKCHQGPTFRF